MGDLVQLFAQAIAQMEGYYKPGTIAARNKNPGNLRGGSRQVGIDKNGYGMYADDSAGWADLYDQIKRNIGRGLTPFEFFAGKPGIYPGYAPSADKNDPLNYARFVASKVGIPIDRPIGTATPAAAGEQLDPGPVDPESFSESGSVSVWIPIAVTAAGAALLWMLLA